jgi:TRAP-type transport system periplasmic protein
LKAKGMNILPPPPQLSADLKKVGEVLVGDWLKKAEADGGKAVIDAYRKP